MSRATASGELEGHIDRAGIRRFRLTSYQESVSRVVRDWQTRPDGFIVGIFSFHAREEAERRAVRESLRCIGFKRIAQLTCINGMIDMSGLEAELSRAGVSDRFYLFRCPSMDDEALLARLVEVFDVKARARELERFLDEPPIPARILPRSYPLAGLAAYLGSVIAARWKSLENYYRTLCGPQSGKGEREWARASS